MKKVYLIAAFVAILAGFATYLFASSLIKSQTIKGIKTYPVVVAIQDIPENTVITVEMVQLKQVVEGAVAKDAVTSLDKAVTYLNKYPVVAGEQIIATKISKVGEDRDNTALSYQLKKGEYAYTLAVDNVQGVSGFISKGDLVDILYTETDKSDSANKVITKILMRNIYILRVSNYAANLALETSKTPITGYAELVLKLSEQQVIELTEKQSSGTIKLILKSIAANQNTESQTGDTSQTSQAVPTTKAG